MVGAARRYGPRSSAPEAYAQIERELDVIAALKFPGYFLVVHEIVDFARREGIACQGRGSAAGSIVAYALEQEGHGLVPGIASCDHQQAVGFALRVVTGRLAGQQVGNLLPCLGRDHVLVDMAHLGFGKDLGLELAFGR